MTFRFSVFFKCIMLQVGHQFIKHVNVIKKNYIYYLQLKYRPAMNKKTKNNNKSKKVDIRRRKLLK